MTYRIRDGETYQHFTSITTAENYKLDNRLRAPIELWYKKRWHIMGGIPEPKLFAL